MLIQKKKKKKSKKDSAFFAKSITDAGIIFIALGYDLCPSGKIFQLL